MPPAEAVGRVDQAGCLLFRALPPGDDILRRVRIYPNLQGPLQNNQQAIERGYP